MSPTELPKGIEGSTKVLIPFPGPDSTFSLGLGLTVSPQTSAPDRESTPVSGSQAASSPASDALTPIDIDILYRAKDARSSNFSNALALLTEASRILHGAKQAVDEGSLLESDSQLLQFQALLPKLFECRAIGEGFANVTNTIQLGIANLKGQPLNAAQVNAVWRAVRQLSVGPFITFESSIDVVEDLDDVGITLRSEFLSEWLSETSTYGKNE